LGSSTGEGATCKVTFETSNKIAKAWDSTWDMEKHHMQLVQKQLKNFERLTGLARSFFSGVLQEKNAPFHWISEVQPHLWQ
jgi:hypothetical protein